MNDFLALILLVLFFLFICSIAGAYENCRVMKKNGHDTHLETWGFVFKDCYIGDVPYDRYIGAELK